jgi:hypothetical protein
MASIPRNPHMRGTASALRILFGKGVGSDRGGEFVETVNHQRFHVFSGFALVNVLLCSAGPEGSSTGRSTSTMHTNCLGHFAATLKILEPTVLILQGKDLQRWIRPVVAYRKEILPELAEAETVGSRCFVCRFSHPSARGDLRWGDRLDAN